MTAIIVGNRHALSAEMSSGRMGEFRDPAGAVLWMKEPLHGKGWSAAPFTSTAEPPQTRRQGGPSCSRSLTKNLLHSAGH